MERKECPNCGLEMKSTELTCSVCGYKLRLDFKVIGIEDRDTYEPPVEQWSQEQSQPKAFSDESLREVKDEFKRRKVSQKKNSGLSRRDSKKRQHRVRSYSSRSKPSFISYVFGVITLISLLFWIFQSSGISINGIKSPNSLKVGDCVIDLPSAEDKSTSISSVKTVECALSHNWEVIYNGEISGNLFRESARDEYVGNQCEKQKSKFLTQPGVSTKSKSQDLGIQYILPSAESWLQGDRFYSCLLGDSVKKTVGHLIDVHAAQPSK